MIIIITSRLADVPGRRTLRLAATNHLVFTSFKLSTAAELFQLPPERSEKHCLKMSSQYNEYHLSTHFSSAST